ncbi:MAG: OadG family protein [Lachnospiraceae bacterium]|nr:OadG family protein [Candidatus Minthocola equi]
MEFEFVTATAKSTGDILGEGLVNMLIGLFVVFSVLVFLCIIIWAFKFLGKIGGGETAPAPAPAAPAAAPAPKAAPAAAKPAGPGTMKNAGVNLEDEVDADTAAAILGAVASECGGDFKVTSIKKSK